MRLFLIALKEIKTRIIGEGNRKKILSNVIWLTSDSILRMVVNLIVGIWVARYLKPEGYGIYNYAIAFIGMFSAIPQLGLESIIIREIVKRPDNKDEILGTSFCLRFITSIITIIFILVIISFLKSIDSLTFWLIAIIAIGFIFDSFTVIDNYFQSLVASKYIVYSRNAAFLIVNIIKIIIILFHATIIAFAITYLIEIIFGSIFIVIAYRINKQHILKWKLNYIRAKNLLKDSWALIFTSMMILIYMRLDQIMIGNMLSKKDVGIYSAAARIAELWYFIPAAIATSFFPSIVNAKTTNSDQYLPRLQKLYTLMTWLGIFVGLFVMLFSKLLIKILLGMDYIESASILTISIWAGIFVAQGMVRGKWAITENLQRFSIWYICIGLVVNVILNYIWIPIYHSKGAAMATLISQFIVAIVAPAFFRQTRISSIMLIKSFNPFILLFWFRKDEKK